MDLRPIQVSSYPFIFEASGDSEDDHDHDFTSNPTECKCDLCNRDVLDDDDDAESCSCDSWGTSCANGCVEDDEEHDGGNRNDEDYDNDDEDRSRIPKAGVADFVMGSVSQDQEEEEEIVQATTVVLREAMDAMGDREFWEACLATGYA